MLTLLGRRSEDSRHSCLRRSGCWDAVYFHGSFTANPSTSGSRHDDWHPLMCLPTNVLMRVGSSPQVLLSVCSLLTDPNPADPLVGSIAKQLTEDKDAHERTAAEWTKRYAQG